jgi:HEAT repeat protein
MNSPFKASAEIAPTGWYNLAKFSMADDSQAEKVTHWNGLSIDAKEILARDTNDATYLMLALGEENDYFVRKAAAWNENATPEVLLRALQNDDPGVRKAAAENRKATPEVLLKALALEGEENVYVRIAAALNGNAKPEVLLKAVEDDDPHVREAAAWNKNATAEVKTKFVLRYYLENRGFPEFPEVDFITPAAISALVRDQRVNLERLGDQIESSPFRNNEYIRASIQLEKKRREKQ